MRILLVLDGFTDFQWRLRLLSCLCLRSVDSAPWSVQLRRMRFECESQCLWPLVLYVFRVLLFVTRF